VVLDALQRLEARITQAVRPVTATQEALHSTTEGHAIYREWQEQQGSEQTASGLHLPESSAASDNAIASYPAIETEDEPISFSGFSILFWPAVQEALPNHTASLVETLDRDLPAVLESRRPTLAPVASQQYDRCADSWLSRLTVTTVKQLCDAFLSTFNLSYPMIDRGFFFQHTLSAAIAKGFGFDLETCLVLVVMALGCRGLNSLLRRDAMSKDFTPDPLAKDIQGVNDDIPGLIFFNESRKRIGFVTSDSNIQSCQYYLLAGYAQSCGFCVGTRALIELTAPFTPISRDQSSPGL
jgi:hypothetical protein